MTKSMKTMVALLAATTLLVLGAVSARAQQIPPQANPTPGCTTTPAQLEANKKAALDFAFLTGQAKVDLADPTYIQHQPVQHKRAQAEGITDYEIFKRTFMAQAAAAPAAAAPAAGRGAAGPQPPAGNRAEIVIAQCDITVVIHKVFLQDPTEAPGKFYEAFTFDAYRVKNGKVTEHWDANTIPAPAAGRGQ